MLNYRKIINGIATSTLLFTLLAGTGCSPSEQPTTIVTGTPTPTLEQVVTQTPEANAAQANPTPTAIPFMPTPFPHDEKSEMPLDSRLAFVAQDEEYIEDIWITDGTEIRRMTHDLDWETDLAWSQDGKTLFYFSTHLEQDIDRNRENTISTYNALDIETGEIREIYEIDLLTPIYGGVAFDYLHFVGLSPDTSQVAFIEFQRDYSNFEKEVTTDLLVFDTETSERIYYEEWVDSDYFYNSPGGIGWLDEDTLFIQTKFTDSDALYKYDLKTSEMEKIVDGNYNGLEFNQALGKFIFEDKDENGDYYYYEMDKDGQNIRKLVEESFMGDTWLSDGSLMHVSYDDNRENPEIEITDRYNEKETLSFFEDEFRDLIFRVYNIETSSNWENIVFEARHIIEPRYNDHIYVGNLGTETIYSLEDFGKGYPFFFAHDFEVAWSPGDGDFSFSDDVKIVDEFEEELLTINSIDEKVVFSLYDISIQADIWTLEGDNLVRLTNSYYDERDVSVSPDGSKIFFSQYNIDSEYGAGYIMDSDGSNRRQLFTFRRGIQSPYWFPDGDKLAFLAVDEDYWPNLYFYDFNTSETDMFWEDVRRYDISPDGKEVVFVSEDIIHYLNLETGRSSSIEGNFSWRELIQYSPTGEQILISSEDPFNNRLYVGEDINNLTFLDDNFHIGASWSPKGENIVYTTRDEDTCRLIVSNKDGSEKRIILEQPRGVYPYPSEGGCYSSPIFSPSGETILYTLELGYNGVEHGIGRLYAINIDGTNNRKIPMDFVEGFSINVMNLDPFIINGSGYDFFPQE